MNRNINFYEVRDKYGLALWGGSSNQEAIRWFRSDFNNSLSVSVWDESNPVNPVLITDKIDITYLLLGLISSYGEERYPPKRSKEMIWR